MTSSSHMGEPETGGGGVSHVPISSTLQNRSALLRAIATTEKLRKRQEQEQKEDALRNPPTTYQSVGIKSRSPMMTYRRQSLSSDSPIASAKSLAYSSYPINASYPSSLGWLYISYQYILNIPYNNKDECISQTYPSAHPFGTTPSNTPIIAP